ncbi:hypothetical protein L1887_27365 [Cichorium endivia]|nr:hypothetical protein L1887_27365 [Cichorium endivia]
MWEENAGEGRKTQMSRAKRNSCKAGRKTQTRGGKRNPYDENAVYGCKLRLVGYFEAAIGFGYVSQTTMSRAHVSRSLTSQSAKALDVTNHCEHRFEWKFSLEEDTAAAATTKSSRKKFKEKVKQMATNLFKKVEVARGKRGITKSQSASDGEAALEFIMHVCAVLGIDKYVDHQIEVKQ